MRATVFVLLCTMGFMLYLANRIDNRMQLMENHLMQKIQAVRSAMTRMALSQSVTEDDVVAEEEGDAEPVEVE